MLRSSTLVVLISILLAGCGMPPAPTTAPSQAETASPDPTTFPSPEILPTPTLMPTPVPDTLFVDPAASLGPISPLVYGSNYGPWLAVSFEMLPAAYDSGVTILRFPAGSWGDHNDVRPLQIDQFMDFAGQVGATAIFNVRLLDGTVEQAAEMVRYTNIEKKYNVHYWSIGNEPTLFDGEMKNRGESYDVERFNKEWREFALAMKAVDPTIELVGAEINQFSHDPSGGATTNFGPRDEEWFVEFLKANGDLVDVVSFHRYPFPRSRVSGPPSIEELRQSAQEWDRIIIHARELIHRHTGRDLPIAVTEFNSAYDKSVGGDATPDSHYNAIWMADVLGRMIKNGVFMANEWALTAKGGYGGLGLIAQDDVFPAYYTYQLYRKFGEELVYSSSDAPELSIYAARRADGALTVMVINLSLEEKEKALRIGDQARVEAETWLFDPSHKAENLGKLPLSGEISFPGQSITLYIIQ
ncbi:MAG: hypothetical protein WCC12_11335 [Anaerolineales bacterium]